MKENLKEKDKENKPKNKERTVKLRFLDEIFRRLGLTRKAISDLTIKAYEEGDITKPYSTQLLNWYFKEDSVTINNIKEIFKALGIDFDYEFIPIPGSKYDQQQTDNRYTNYEIEMDDILQFQTPKSKRKNRSDIIYKTITENSILKPVAELCVRIDIDLPEFATIMEWNYLTAYQRFKYDRIKVDTVYEIAEKFDQRVHWKLSDPKNSDKNEQIE